MVRSSGPLEFPGTVRSKRRRTRIGRPFPFFLPGAGVSDLETALARSRGQALTHHLAIRASRQLSGRAATCALQSLRYCQAQYPFSQRGPRAGVRI